MARVVTESILQCARECILNGHVKRYKSFWNTTLSQLKDTRNKARWKAEASNLLQDCTELCKRQATLTQATLRQGKEMHLETS